MRVTVYRGTTVHRKIISSILIYLQITFFQSNPKPNYVITTLYSVTQSLSEMTSFIERTILTNCFSTLFELFCISVNRGWISYLAAWIL